MLPAVKQKGLDGAQVVHGEEADGSVALEAQELLHLLWHLVEHLTLPLI